MRPLHVIPPSQRALVRALGAVLLAGLAVYAAWLILHFAGTEGDRLFGVYVLNGLTLCGAVLVLLRGLLVGRQRVGWLVLGIGSVLWAAAGWWWALVLEGADAPPFPSVADGLWLAFYPCAYVAILLIVRGHLDRTYASMWLDGLVGALTVAAVAGALFLGPIADASTGELAAVVTNIAYPVGDMLLLAFVAGVVALLGWRPGPAWGLLAGGISALAVADSIYLLRVANETYRVGTLLDGLWPLSFACLAAGAWWPSQQRPPVQLTGLPVLVMPLVCALAAAGLLLHGNHHPITPVAQGLAALAIVAALLRTALTFREVQSLADSRRQALTDELTGLGNRRFLQGELDLVLTEAEVGDEAVAVLVIDLDGFKDLNDTLGHVAGDQLLGELGPRLRRALPDDAVIARQGGDEFAVVLRDASSLRAPLVRAEDVRRAVGEPFVFEGLTLRIGASVGIAMFPEHGVDRGELLQRADVAMYQAKAQRSGARLYEPASDESSRDRLALMSDLRHGLANDELVLHYQPKAGLRGAEVVGVEALVRWLHPERGLLGPHLFLGLAEQLGLMGTLTASVLRKAVAQGARWRAEGLEIPVAVNLSAPNLLDTELPETVAAVLAEFGLPPRLLQLEITEDTLMVDPARAVEVLERVRALGVRFALDDFGTGYSSLAYLKRLAVDELKIDRSFVMNMLHDDGDAIIVRSTIDLARNLGLHTVAEGVEDEATWRRLTHYGCDIAQGYVLSRPLPADELAVWVRDWTSGRFVADVADGDARSGSLEGGAPAWVDGPPAHAGHGPQR